MPTCGQAKRAGQKFPLRADWEEVKREVMLDLLRQKFAGSPLREMLLATGDAELVEGNTWGDTYWGVCRGVGQNWLGRLLMQVREEIISDDNQIAGLFTSPSKTPTIDDGTTCAICKKPFKRSDQHWSWDGTTCQCGAPK